MTFDSETADYDSPWKNALECYFRECIEFFLPEMAQDVDWERGYLFLDKELQQVSKNAAIGRRYADKLVQLYRKDGSDEWVLAHVEVQGQKRKLFSERMYTYNYRTFDLFHRKVASIAILADENPLWRPDHFSYELWGSRAGLWFPCVKLLDYSEKWSELEASTNPFASVVMAHLKAVETKGDNEQRYRWKLILIKRLYRQGYAKADVIRLFAFIDWVMSLPADMEKGLWTEIQKFEEETKMEYVTSVERIGMEKGMEKGSLNLLCRQIAKRFKTGYELLPPIFTGLRAEDIEEIGERFLDAESVDEIRRWAEEKRRARMQ
ncbi:MAG TPA: DUF4351 domain-containing protein [Deltaproteobacteria bacterium]|nr:DUF4351 domain-containing protein [Deltaproteobacteria bacterium]